MIGNHRLTLQAKKRVSDGEGGFVVDWKNLRKVWATVKPINAYEKLKYGSKADEISHVVTMRYDPSIKSSNRFVFNGRILDIQGTPINVDELGVEMQLICLETSVMTV